MKGRQGRRECHGKKKKKSSWLCAHVGVAEVPRAQGRCGGARQASGPAQGGLRGRAGRGAHCGAAEPGAWRPPSAGLLPYSYKGWGRWKKKIRNLNNQLRIPRMRKPLSASKIFHAARSFHKASRIQRGKTSLPPAGGERGREAVQGAAMRCPEPPPVAKRPAGPPPGPAAAAAAHSPLPLRAAPSPRRSAAAVPGRPSEPAGTRSRRRRRDLGHPARRPAKVRAGGGGGRRAAVPPTGERGGRLRRGPSPPRGEGKGPGTAGSPAAPGRSLPATGPGPQRGMHLLSLGLETLPPPPSPRACQRKAIPVCASGESSHSGTVKVLRESGEHLQGVKVPASWGSTQRASILPPYPIPPTCQADQCPFFPSIYPEGFWSSKFKVS